MLVLKKILNWIEKKVPHKKSIIFHSFPDYSDNSYALFRYMIKNGYQKYYEIIWLINDSNQQAIISKIYEEFSIDIKCYKKNSLIGLYQYLRAEKAFCTHGIFSFLNNENEKKINLWHGMPLKNIGYLDKNAKKPISCSYSIATNLKFQEIISKSFNIKKEKVFVVGQPRNDLLFEETKYYEKKNIDKKLYEKIIFWLPTYRKSIIGDIREDGNFKTDKVGLIEIDRLNEFNSFLEKNKYLLFIKLHPMDILQEYNFKNFSNIIFLKSKDLEEINEQLYPLLGSSDLLITDYSSVWIDYEILGKPIYFAMEDYEEYKQGRGFTIENLFDISPGEIITNYSDLLDKLLNIPSTLQYETKDSFNLYKDNNSCKRIGEILLKKMKN